MLVGLVAAALLAPQLFSAPASGAGAATATPEPGRSLAVETYPLSFTSGFVQQRAYSGEIAARRGSDLGFERSGRLLEVALEEGARVAVGEVLAKLDAELLEATRSELTAAVQASEAALAEMVAGPREQTIEAARALVLQLEIQRELWEKKRVRREGLRAEKHISEEEVEEAASQVAVFAARIAGARSELEELEEGTRPEQIAAQRARLSELQAKRARLQIEIDKSTLRAPYPGTVTRRLADEGEYIASSTPVMRLVEDGRLEARIGLPLAATRSIQPGDEVQLEAGLGRDARRLPARVAAVLPEIDPATRTLTVLFVLEPGARAVAGELARLRLPQTIESRGAWIPASALTRGARGLWAVFVLVHDGDSSSVERREVEVLHTEAERVYVRGTIAEGDEIVLGSAHRLVPGQRAHDTTREGSP